MYKRYTYSLFSHNREGKLCSTMSRIGDLCYNNAMENNIKETTTQYIADNIAYYRKKMALTQLELAEKLNYSDKSISKWERAEGVPDIFVLQKLSKFFGISIDQLISKRKIRYSLFKHRYILAYFYASIVWLLAGIAFGVLSLMDANYPAWTLLVYAVPLSSLVLMCFFFYWRQIRYIVLYITTFVWSMAFSITLAIHDYSNYWVYIITLPIYLFTLFMIYIIYKRKK